MLSIIKQKLRKPEDIEKERKNADLLADINEITSEIARCHRRYDLVTDDDLVEALIYEELSLRSRYAYLMKRARDENLVGKAGLK